MTLKPMLNYSMSVSVDGYIADREGAFEWGAPSEELFRSTAVSATPPPPGVAM